MRQDKNDGVETVGDKIFFAGGSSASNYDLFESYNPNTDTGQRRPCRLLVVQRVVLFLAINYL